MDIGIVLIAVSVSTLVIIICLVLLIRSRGTRRFNKSVVATITQIKVEASTMSNWWVVIAQWSDTQSGQTLVFRSPHLKFECWQNSGHPSYTMGKNHEHPEMRACAQCRNRCLVSHIPQFQPDG